MKLGFLLWTGLLLLLAVFNAAIRNYVLAGGFFAVVLLRSIVQFNVIGRLKALRRTEGSPSMAATRKTPRRKSRRVRMAEAVRKACAPALLELGFRNPKQVDRARWDGGRPNNFIRWRGTTYEEVTFQWDVHNWAMFEISFCVSVVEQEPNGDENAVRLQRFGSMRSSRYIPGWFGPWRSISSVAAQAARRVHQLEAYLRRGETGWWIVVGPARRISAGAGDPRVPAPLKIWGDPWLDPESDYEPESAKKRQA